MNSSDILTIDKLYAPFTFNGYRICVVKSWALGYAWRYYIQPKIPPHGERKGTRKQWKRNNPRGWRWRYGIVEPDDMIIIGTNLFCTEAQAKQLETAVK